MLWNFIEQVLILFIIELSLLLRIILNFSKFYQGTKILTNILNLKTKDLRLPEEFQPVCYDCCVLKITLGNQN